MDAEDRGKGKGKGKEKGGTGKGSMARWRRGIEGTPASSLYDDEWDMAHGGVGEDGIHYTRSQWLSWYYDVGSSYIACHCCYLEQQLEELKIEVQTLRNAFLMVRDGWCDSRDVLGGVYRE
jgi:hypothetical protein